MRLLNIVFLLVLWAGFSACSIREDLTGQRVIPSDVSDTANQGALSFERNNAGEIIAVCCQTACMNADSVAEFQDSFIASLNSLASSRDQFRQIATQVVFENRIPKACNADNSIDFTIVDANNRPTNTTPVSINPEVLESSNSHPQRAALSSLLNKWKLLASRGSGEKLKIMITTCGDTSSIPTQCNSGSSSDSQGEVETHSEECMPCVIPPSSSREYRLDWGGLI